MLSAISGTQQAMLWLAVILCGGFTCFVIFAIIPLVKAFRDQNELLRILLQSGQFFPKSTESIKSTILEKINKNSQGTTVIENDLK